MKVMGMTYTSPVMIYTNIASQRIARTAGYYPAWICIYMDKFDGLECSPMS